MALKDREKLMVGGMMITGGLALLIGLGLPQFDAVNANLTQKGELETQIKGMEVQQQALHTEIDNLQKRNDLPKDIVIRQFTSQNREQIIKAMVDEIVNLAAHAGNKLISLEPHEVEPLFPPPAPVDPKAAPVDATATDPNAAPAPPPQPLLEAFGYTMAVRGSYNQVQDFLKSMFSNKELIEVTSIELQNENGVTRGGATASTTTVPIDYSRPIKLITKMRLVLEPAQ